MDNAATGNALADVDPLLTAKEVMEWLGIANGTFYDWVNRGILPKPVCLGRWRRWPKSEIEAVLERAKEARAVS